MMRHTLTAVAVGALAFAAPAAAATATGAGHLPFRQACAPDHSKHHNHPCPNIPKPTPTGGVKPLHVSLDAVASVATVTGTVTEPLHFTAYRVIGHCVGTTISAGNCDRQTVTTNETIPTGTYDHEPFGIIHIACGPYQEDVYSGPPGNAHVYAGQLVQQPPCETAPLPGPTPTKTCPSTRHTSSSPPTTEETTSAPPTTEETSSSPPTTGESSSSAPPTTTETSTSAPPSTSAVSTPHPSSSAPSTTAARHATAPAAPPGTTSAVPPAAGGAAPPPPVLPAQMAFTGVAHPLTTAIVGLGVALLGAALVAGAARIRRVPLRRH